MIKALTFDVFGTVLDWRGTIESEGRRITGADVDWGALAVAWSKTYGKLTVGPWERVGVHLAYEFYDIRKRFGLESLDLEKSLELAHVWSRLGPWPDAVPGFEILKGRVVLAALTNADASMLRSLAESSGLPWDRLLSSELAQCFKPDPAIYRMALSQLGLPAEEVMMVASHCFDLNAARKEGFRTALINRPNEPGSDPSGLDHEPDFIAEDIEVFARDFARERGWLDDSQTT